MNKIHLLFITALMLTITATRAQKMTVHKAAYFDKTPPLREMKKIEPGVRDRSWKDNVIRNETNPRRDNGKRNTESRPIGPDPLWQKQMGSIRTNDPIQNFEGTPNVNGVYPPDTDGDVGPNHYYQMINLSFQIFDKEGNSLYGPADNSTLWDGFIGPWTGTNDGDPILLYDEEADRWLASQFAINTDDGSYWELLAVSKTSDPTGEYYRYAFEFPAFNDYPKLSIWNDAYYASFNMFGSYNRVAAAAFDRDAMLNGDPEAEMVLFDLPSGSQPWSMLPADFDGTPPPDGAPNYFAYMEDDAFGNDDEIVFWEFDVDWDEVSNSTFEEAFVIDVSPFDSEICPAYRQRCIPQPGTGVQLETLADRLMFRLQYRNFGDYQVMLTNHTVDVDGTGHAGIRWYEFRNDNDGDGWYLRQEGSYAPDSDNRWMGSIAMNNEGIIALGYSVSSANTYPSIRYTGRGPNSPLGEMVFTEESVIEGSGSQLGDAARWGDYAMMSVDPSDGETFWFTTEYMENTGSVGWQTRIASFLLEEDFTPPEPVTDLQVDEPTTNGVWLHWTATSDNQGKPDEYDIRYSVNPITSDNWEEATPVAGSPEPYEAGQPQQFYISDLSFNQEYYFAMKVLDRQDNISDMSNVVSTTTPGLPNIEASTDTIEETLHQTFTSTVDYQISNTGESDIRVSFTKNDTLTHQAGAVLRSYDIPVSGVLGAQEMDGKLYLVAGGQQALLTYDTLSQTITDTASIHEEPFGITFDGEYLWIGDKSGIIRAYTKDGDATGMSFDIRENGYHAIAFSGDRFLINKVNRDNPLFQVYSANGDSITTYQSNLGFTIWQTTWVEQHRSGHLWMTNNDGLIAQLRLENNMFTPVQSFDAPATVSYSLAHDGSDLVYTQLTGTVSMVDDGISEVNWVELIPRKDTIPAQQERDIGIKFKTLSLPAGSYYGETTLHSNDPDEEELIIPLKMEVLPYTPIDLTTSSSADTVCSETPVMLTASADNGTGDYGALWTSNPDGFSAQTFDVTVTPEVTTTYYLAVTDGMMTVQDSIVVHVKPSPQIDLGEDTSICRNHELNLQVSEGYQSYLWQDESTETTFTIDSTNAEIGLNEYWVSVTGTNGCVTTDTVTVTMESCAGIQQFGRLTLRLFPNPTEGKSRLTLKGVWDEFSLRIVDNKGQQLLQRTIKEGKGSREVRFDISPHAPGLYYVVLESGNESVVKKLIRR